MSTKRGRLSIQSLFIKKKLCDKIKFKNIMIKTISRINKL